MRIVADDGEGTGVVKTNSRNLHGGLLLSGTAEEKSIRQEIVHSENGRARLSQIVKYSREKDDCKQESVTKG